MTADCQRPAIVTFIPVAQSSCDANGRSRVAAECALRKEREKEAAKAARERENAKSEDGTMSGRDQLTEDDFIIEYIDDSDTDVDG